jgi:hypothetical protein
VFALAAVNKWLREIPPAKSPSDGYCSHPVWVCRHPLTLPLARIKNGDVVSSFERSAAVLVGAYDAGALRSMPEVVYIEARVPNGVIHDPGVIDRGGAINTFCARHINSRTRWATRSPFERFLVDVEMIRDLEESKRNIPKTPSKGRSTSCAGPVRGLHPGGSSGHVVK